MRDRIVRWVRLQPWAGVVTNLQLLRQPSRARGIFGDLRRTRRDAAFARALPPAPPDAPVLLVLGMTNNLYTAKLECMQALGLRQRGWRVEVLTSNLYPHAKSVYRSYGISDFVSYERVISSDVADQAVDAEVARRAAGAMDFQSVLAWTYRDAWIGPQLLSSVSRQSFDGAPDPRVPAVREVLLRLLAQSIRFVHAAEAHFDKAKPDLILVNEPNYHAIGPFVDVAIARGVPVIHFTQPSREDALVQKKLTRETRRIHPNSVTAETLDRLMTEPWGATEEAVLDREFSERYGGKWKIQARNQPGTQEMGRSEIQELLGLDPTKPTAVVFSHVLWDANLFYGRDLFDNYGHWFIETVKAAVANPRLNWLIKLHPANIWKRKLSGAEGEFREIALIREQIGDLPPHVHLLHADTPISTLSLFGSIDAGITVRGSIGYELPCFGVPVVTAGTGRFSGFGFTLDHDSREAYLATLARLETVPRLDPEQVRRARVHAHALFVRRPWLYRSFRTEIGVDVSDPLFQNLVPTVSSWEEIDGNGDLQAFAHWAAEEPSVDFLKSDTR